MLFKNLFKKEKEYKKMNYKHIKLRCKNCGETIEGDGKGTYISCSCGKVAVDEVKPYYTRIIGNEEDFETIEQSLYEEALEKCKNNEEIWKWVVGYERWYEISNLGNVRKINDDGTKRLLTACDVPKEYTRGRIVNLVKTGEKQKVVQICKLVAEAFNIPNTKKSKTLYHIDGNVNNDCLTNLTYDEKETEAYIEEQRKFKEEQERLELEKQEKENHKEELLNYIEENKEFLKEAKERNKEITITDIYNKLCEILEVLKYGNR